MVHERLNSNVAAMRRTFPLASIIRRIGVGHYLAFDETSDALGHPSTERQPRPVRAL